MSFTLMLNTWYYMICDTCGLPSAEAWKVGLKSIGLSKVISSGDEAADAVLHDRTPNSNLWYGILQAVMLRSRRPRVWNTYDEWTMEPEDIQMFLQISRYAKRFTPTLHNPDYAAVDAFLNYQSELRNLTRTHSGNTAWWWITSRMRERVATLLDWDRLCDELEACWEEPADLEFTPKANNDIKLDKKLMQQGYSTTSLYAKLHNVFRLCQTDDGAEFYLQQRYLSAARKKGRFAPIVELRLLTAFEAGQEASLLLVPKNYKTFRTIAPEPTFWSAKALRCFRIMEKYLPSNIHLHDQRFNKALLERASVGYPLATVDNSMASDGVTWEFVLAVYPSRFVKILDKMLTHRVGMKRFGRPTIWLESMATMGNPLTFIMESLSFLLADQEANTLAGLPETTEVWDEELGDFISVPQVYGDDQVTWSQSVPVLEEICTVLGWKLNMDKTYTSGFYREACGLEVYRGKDVTPVYWPRRPMGEPTYSTYHEKWETDLGALVSLQKELFFVSPGASNLLTSVILTLKPDMTSSAPGTNCSDIWAVVPRSKKLFSPYATIQRQVRVYSYFDGDISDLLVEPHLACITREIGESEREVESICKWIDPIASLKPTKRTVWTTDDECTPVLAKTIRRGFEQVANLPKFQWDVSEHSDYIVYHQDGYRRVFEYGSLERRVAGHTSGHGGAAGLHFSDLELPDYLLESEEFVVLPCKKGKHRWILGKLTGIVRAYELPSREESYVELHDSCCIHYKDLKLQDPLTEYWIYRQYLESGPRYEHSADTLEGIIERCAGITVSRGLSGTHLHPSTYLTPTVEW